MKVKFEVIKNHLHIDGKKVIRAWESITGWYWFAIEEADRQDSVINDKVYENDIIFFGFVQGFEEEWGYFSLAELQSLKGKVWELPQKAILYSGRRS